MPIRQTIHWRKPCSENEKSNSIYIPGLLVRRITKWFTWLFSPKRVILTAASLLVWPVRVVTSWGPWPKIQRFSGVAGDGKASLTAVTLRCLLTLQAKTLNSFLSLPESLTTSLLSNRVTLRFIELEQHSSSVPWYKLYNCPVPPGLQAPHPITSRLLNWLNVLEPF